MKTPVTFVLIHVCLCTIPGSLVAQVAITGVPALSITASPLGNGMGGISSTLPSLEPAATIANPAQLGLFSLSNLFGASTYAPKTELLPGLWAPDRSPMTLTASAVNAGVNIGEFLDLPFSAGIGIGYSRAYADWGKFYITSSFSPDVIGSAAMNDTYENYSVGLGLEYVARLGIGMNFKRITSRMPGIGSTGLPGEFTATPSATDFGVLLDLPVAGVISRVRGTDLAFAGSVEPYLNVSLSYVKSNVGDDVRFLDAYQPDPLPRTATAGAALTVGLSANAGHARWKMISCGLVHQAEDLLVIRHMDGTFEFQGGAGSLRFMDNVVVGRVTGDVLVRKGWELGAGEFVYLRGGSVLSTEYDYATTGYSICLGGLVRMLEFASEDIAGTAWLAFIGDHIDVQYHAASYSAPAQSISSVFDGTSFRELTLVFRGFPW